MPSLRPAIALKRVYEAGTPDDGYRVFVDRLWPRGIKRDALHFDEWDKEIAPSDSLRRWFGHDPARWSEFRRAYRAELRKNRTELDALIARAHGSRMTLLYAARDPSYNHAVVLKEVLERHTGSSKANARGGTAPAKRRTRRRVQ